MTARTGTPPGERRALRQGGGAGAVVVSQLLIRTASAAGALVVGGYFVGLARHGVPVGSVLLGFLAALSFLAEIVVAPFAGAATDRRGRRAFLVLAPALAAAGVLLTPGASLTAAAPPLILVAVVVGAGRLLDGAGAGTAVPATLGLLADATDDDRIRRGRLTSMYELASSGGIALGAVLGPLLYATAGLWAFALLAGLYLMAALIVLLFVRREVPQPMVSASLSRRARLQVLTHPRLAAFLPAWIAVNAILGTWVTSQITFVLAGDRAVAGQRFPGAFAAHPAGLSAVLGIYVLVFSACILVWSFFIGRLRPLPTMLVTVAGSVMASSGLVAANHRMPLSVAIPIVVAGVFLEAGFTPAALSHLADISAEPAGERGLIMGAYSVALGIGYLVGNILGGVFAAWLAFDGLGILTILLAAFAAGSVAAAMHVEKRSRQTPGAVQHKSQTPPAEARSVAGRPQNKENTMGTIYRAVWNGTVLAESDQTIRIEGNEYFPPDTINAEYFRDTPLTSVCPWKGTARYYSIEANGKTNPEAAWYYPQPAPAAAQIKGYVAFWKGVKVKKIR